MRTLICSLIAAITSQLFWCCCNRLCADEPLPAHWTRLTSDGRFKQRPTWSPDGKRLLFSRHVDEQIHLIRCDAEGKHEERLFENQHPRMDAVTSPDGKRLAFVWDKVSPGQGDMELYLADATGENPEPLFITAGKLSHEEWPSWSPDGEWLACTSTRDDNSELYLIKVDGSEKQRLTSNPALDVHPAFSPDGTRIAFATDRWGDLEIAVYDVRTSLITRLTESHGLDDHPAWSPDGKQLAWTSNRTGDREIWLMSADGSAHRNLTQRDGPDQFPAFMPNSDMTCVSFVEGEWDVYRLRP